MLYLMSQTRIVYRVFGAGKGNMVQIASDSETKHMCSLR